MNQRVHAPSRARTDRATRRTAPTSGGSGHHSALLALQRSAGNQRLARLLAGHVTAHPAASRAMLFRDVNSAAQELFDGGHKTVKKNQLKGKFAKTHGITANDLDAIAARLAELREARPTEVVEAVDLTDEANWPTEGGMREDEAAAVAEVNDWTVDTTKWRCRDVAHTPKGRVYTNGDVYYGADNTGHVGWGFKIWTRDGGTWLRYSGNMVWNGAAWAVIARGT